MNAERFTRGYGLLEASLEEVIERLPAAIENPASFFKIVQETTVPQEAFTYLSHLTHPPTRHVLFSAGRHWTAIINNSRNGSDFADYALRFSKGLGVRALRVVNEEGKTWERGGERGVATYEARIIEIYGANGASLKNIACMNDGGRWTFSVSGQDFDVESTFDYKAKKIRERFSEKNMSSFLQSLDIPSITAGSLLSSERFVLAEECFKTDGMKRLIQETSCTTEQADDPAYGFYKRGLGWVKHMNTHAESVIADFERAIRINPAYEPRVREFLKQAHAIVEKEKRR